MKHYIIWNCSSEWDDHFGESEPVIEYISSNLEDALAYFDKTFGDTPSLSNDKWKYEYILCEYPDGYKRLDLNEDEVKVIKRIDNYEA